MRPKGEIVSQLQSRPGQVSEALSELQLALDTEAAAKRAVAAKLSKLTRLLSVRRSGRGASPPSPEPAAVPVLVVDNRAAACREAED
jgi:hypothetical protein